VSPKGRIPSAKQRKPGRVPDPPQVDGGTDHLHPVFSFKWACEAGNYCLHLWDSTEVRELVACFKKAEQMTWQQIKATGGKRGRKTGLGFTLLTEHQLPNKGQDLEPDVRDRVFELRTSLRSRILCFRVNQVCHVVWFDSDHAITG
jgi:hypothetical protein